MLNYNCNEQLTERLGLSDAMFLPDTFWQKKKVGVVNRPVMYPQSHVPENASKSAVWEHPLDDARTRWARYKLLM